VYEHAEYRCETSDETEIDHNSRSDEFKMRHRVETSRRDIFTPYNFAIEIFTQFFFLLSYFQDMSSSKGKKRKIEETLRMINSCLPSSHRLQKSSNLELETFNADHDYTEGNESISYKRLKQGKFCLSIVEERLGSDQTNSGSAKRGVKIRADILEIPQAGVYELRYDRSSDIDLNLTARLMGYADQETLEANVGGDLEASDVEDLDSLSNSESELQEDNLSGHDLHEEFLL